MNKEKMDKAEQKNQPLSFSTFQVICAYFHLSNEQAVPSPKKKKQTEDVLFFKVLQYNKYMICTKDTTGPV